MIWVGGAVVPDDALKISVTDRTFEHGLGLFETLRTWQGLAPTLGWHFARMYGSAQKLGIEFPRSFPDEGAVKALLQAEQVVGDVVLRITLSGGLNGAAGVTLWMRTARLPFALHRPGAVVDLGNWSVLTDDALARHKTLNYWARRRANEAARGLGFDETLSMSPDGCIWEGSRTNLFVVRGSSLITPTLEGPIVPGVMRGIVIELAKDLPLSLDESLQLTRETLAGADEVFLTNSVRGIIPVARVDRLSWAAPGEWTRRLQILVADWLSGGGRA